MRRALEKSIDNSDTIVRKVALLGTLLTLIELSSFLLWWGGHMVLRP
jgi:hypothetical protein